MREEMATALIEGVVTYPQIEGAMVVGGHQVPIVGIGVALIMDMDLSQVLDLRGEVLNMVELKALSMKDTTGKQGCFSLLAFPFPSP